MNPSLNTSTTVVNALSVDVEEYFHATIFQEATKGDSLRPREARVEGSIDRILALLDREHVRATFFVLGEVAAAHPEMIKKISGAQHEIACHGYRHERVTRLTPAAFRTDVRRAKGVLEDLTGHPIIGYRAPSFSIGREQTWAHDILLEEGFRYDSSVYPILHDLYGDPKAPRHPFEIQCNAHGRLMEFPVGTARFFGVNFPIGGGGYFRLLPAALIRWGIRWVNEHERRPIVFYIHPWELDPGQPMARMTCGHRFRHYVGLRRMEGKLSSLLRRTPFSTIRDVYGVK